MRSPYLNDGDVRLYLGDCIAVMAEMDAESVDAVVCDPPYGIGFMGKAWDAAAITERVERDNASRASLGPDSPSRPGRKKPRSSSAYGNRAIAAGPVRDHTLTRARSGSMHAGEYDLSLTANAAFAAWCETWAREALRVLKPGGHLLAFGGTRTFHRLTCGIEDAGFEVRDCLSWLYGSGFPKSLDVSKAIDRAAGAEREVVGNYTRGFRAEGSGLDGWQREAYSIAGAITAPATDAAREWQGWGTALKPGYEPAVVARKPHTPQSELAAEAARTKEELCAVVSYAATVTSWFEWLRASGLSSIASSLLGCLDDLSERASMCTTETASSLTTDLATLRFCLSETTRACITKAPTPPHGSSSGASAAEALSRSVLVKCERLSATIAGELAIALPAAPGQTQASALASAGPAWEPCVVARKPLTGTVAENVQQHGTGALNIDGCRIGTAETLGRTNKGREHYAQSSYTVAPDSRITFDRSDVAGGRWPANVAFDEEAAAMLDAQSGERPSGARAGGEYGGIGAGALYGHGGTATLSAIDANTGGASRFFYTAKASRADRSTNGANNTHPTVKPTDLMRWLVRLVTPPGGVVLDPFAGSGSTLVAARAEGFRSIGIEREEEYAEIIAARLSQLSLFSEAS